ncbi:MAG TPA: guanylate kinase [Burkholderiales bacterium]|nr:guanylate kinase [Burkholderiales bacterium]
MSNGTLFIITAPSGAGKTSLVRHLLKTDSNVRLSISHTTRNPRPGEINGKDYHFITEEEFFDMQARGDFLESAKVYGHHYGTSRAFIEAGMLKGHDMVLEIDWQGANQIRHLFKETTGIFILPPSLKELEKRLRARAQDSDDVIRARLVEARADMMHVADFDYVIINASFETALHELQSIVLVNRLRRSRQLETHADLFLKLIK